MNLDKSMKSLTSLIATSSLVWTSVPAITIIRSHQKNWKLRAFLLIWQNRRVATNRGKSLRRSRYRFCGQGGTYSQNEAPWSNSILMLCPERATRVLTYGEREEANRVVDGVIGSERELVRERERDSNGGVLVKQATELRRKKKNLCVSLCLWSFLPLFPIFSSSRFGLVIWD